MSFIIYNDDCLTRLGQMEDASVDAIVTDPPYGLSFMGKKWDYDVPGVDVWAECLRVLKPGGHLLAFAGTRTQHRMAVRIEDAGFEIRDMIAWVYGSGFPKSMDVSKAIDRAAGAEREVVGPRVRLGDTKAYAHNETGGNCYGEPNGSGHRPPITAPATDAARQWQGWGTALKPALEPITVARKPLVGTVAANVLQHGTGALNIDGCRVNSGPVEIHARTANITTASSMSGTSTGSTGIGEFNTGRWPANLIHDGSDEVLEAFPNAPGALAPVTGNEPSSSTSNAYGKFRRAASDRTGEASANSDNVGAVGFKMKPGARRSPESSAARFFYCAKASRADRNEGLRSGDTPAVAMHATMREREDADWASRNGNHHPTVKPTDLMAYLVRLVTPPGGVVLDPFMGSGSTGKAAVLEGFQFIGIERDVEYCEIANARIQAANDNQPRMADLFGAKA